MAFAMPNKTLEFCTAQRPMATAAEIPLTIDQHYFMRWYQLVDGTVSTGQYLVAWVQQLRCLGEDGAAAGSGGAAAGHQQHGVPGVLRQHAELQLSPARCRHHTQPIFTQCPRVTEASFNKYCDIKSQACNQRNVFLQSGPRTRTHHSWAAHLEELIQFIQKFISLIIRGSITVELKQNTKDVHLKFSLGIFNT